MQMNPLAEGATSGGSVFGWYFLGVLLRQLYLWMDWVSKQDGGSFKHRAGLYWKHHTAQAIKEIIASVGIAFIWTLGLVWIIAGKLGFNLPGFGITPLSSLAAGMSLYWLGMMLVWPRIKKLVNGGGQ